MRTIVHLSDLHFGRHDPEVVEALLADIDETAPDLVAVSGDLTQRARRTEFAAARAFLERVDAPLIVVPGNHDVPFYDVARRFLRPLARFRRYISAERRPFFRDAEIAVLGLSTARSLTLKNGRVSLEQMDEIRAAFAGVPASSWKILVTHHPLVPPPGAEGKILDAVGRSEAALEAVNEAGVDLLLAGHYHRAFAGDAGSVVEAKKSLLIVQAGTATSTRTRHGEPNTFNLIRLEPDRLSVAVRALAGGRFVTRDERSYRTADDRWLAE